AASPDDVALCEGARAAGLRLAARRAHGGGALLEVHGPAPGQCGEHAVAQVLEFDSDRKRMSVVCAQADGSAVVYTKGADAALEPLLAGGGLGAGARAALADFSAQGLRTLVCARRELPAAEYAAWKDRGVGRRQPSPRGARGAGGEGRRQGRGAAALPGHHGRGGDRPPARPRTRDHRGPARGCGHPAVGAHGRQG
ncbi:unnamed protein product, partial [Prorocentrum cordatum]